ncbi:ABC transporter substrate-binding protein [Amycolatopsis carbonis]|uniref:ABC transporter substrate-binding protein n=1 Tax=Amycolatopsis carbonis TaxID=715471 RepID=A0A9Y2IAN3_9PSEU|nr:ABC transporter substrate-binding protein [Amycolatopsis sp. 2-15]WIX75630.1 ABC transporter substrate-binding protein [Amycolatopsis sp. 2-15]
MSRASAAVRVLAGIAVGVVSAASITACAPSAGTGGNGPTGVAANGGSMTFVAQYETTTMDPLITYVQSTNDTFRTQAIFDLLAYTDTTGKVVPRIAESITPNAGKTEWTIKIRPGVKFSDGTSYDAAAVKFTIDRDAVEANHSTQYTAAKDLKTTVIDPLTLKVTLPSPNAQFDQVVSQSFSLVPSPTAVQKEGKDFGQHPVGAGPFVLQEWVKGDHMSFARNPQYWQRGLPHLDSVTLKVVEDPQQATNVLLSGEAQLFEVQHTSTLAAGEKAGLQSVKTAVNGGDGLFFNTRRAPFDDRRARQAVAYALDLSELAKVVYHGLVQPPKNLFATDSPYYDSKYDYPAPDKAKAQQLFDQLAVESKRVDFTYVTTSGAEDVKLAQFVQSRLATFRNVTMNIDTQSGAERIQSYRQSNFQMTTGATFFLNPYPVTQSTFATGGVLNYPLYSNPDVDAALADAVTTTEENRRKRDYETFLQHYAHDLPTLPTQATELGVLFTDKVTGVQTFELGCTPFWDQIGYKR